MTSAITGFSPKGKVIWDSWDNKQKDMYLSRELARMACGFLTNSERDMLNFLVKVREEEKKKVVKPKKKTLKDILNALKKKWGDVIYRINERTGRDFSESIQS